VKRRGVRIESLIEVALTVGLLASTALFVAGLALGSSGLLKWGILLLMLTPVARVVILTAGLFRERDTLFGLVSLFVLGVLLSGIVVSSRMRTGVSSRMRPGPTPAAATPVTPPPPR
jgi:uncharacterized membrane protein